jgi:hypothetical protein
MGASLPWGGFCCKRPQRRQCKGLSPSAFSGTKGAKSMGYYEGTATIDGDVQLLRRVNRNVPSNQRPTYWGYFITSISGLEIPQRLGDAWVCVSQTSSGTIVWPDESIVLAYRSVWTEGDLIALGGVLGQRASNLWFRGASQVIGQTITWFYEDNT